MCGMLWRSLTQVDDEGDDSDQDEDEDIEGADIAEDDSTRNQVFEEETTNPTAGEAHTAPADLLLDFAKDVGKNDVPALMMSLGRSRAEFATLAKLNDRVKSLRMRKDEVTALVSKRHGVAIASDLKLVIDTGTLAAQTKIVLQGNGLVDASADLVDWIRLHKELDSSLQIIAGVVDLDLPAFQAWSSKFIAAHTQRLAVADDAISHKRARGLTQNRLSQASAYPFSVLRDFTAIMSQDARRLHGDLKELGFLSQKLEELLVPVTALNWQDVCEDWLTLADLCGEFTGTRSQAILRQIFAGEQLCGAIGMAKQMADIHIGENGAGVPASIILLFKRNAAAALRRDHYMYALTFISDEQACSHWRRSGVGTGT